MLGRIKNLLRDRNFILILSLVFGLSFPQLARYTERVLLLLLMFVMMISMTGITEKILDSPGRWVKTIAVSLALNYFMLGGAMILLSFILKLPDSYRVGFIVLASAPPAIAVIPFTNFLGGDPDYSMVGFTACYIGAFLLTPLTLSTFLGSQPGFQLRILTLLSQLIIVPFLLSRVLVRYGVDEKMETNKGTMVNWSFFVIIYTIVGLNNEVFLREPLSLVPLAAIAVVVTFIMGYIVEKLSESLKVGSGKILSNVLLATSKNSGFAAGIAITLFSVESTVPSTLTTVFMLLYVIFLDLRKKIE